MSVFFAKIELIQLCVDFINRALCDNSYSKMKTKFTVPESVWETYMSTIVNSEHFVKKLKIITNKETSNAPINILLKNSNNKSSVNFS